MSSHDGSVMHATKASGFISRTSDKIKDPEVLQRVANATLREAMTNERSKRWSKVIHNYKHLLRVLGKSNLPPDVCLPPSYSMLMYEVRYHLGIALQHVQEHKKAVLQYTRAIESVFVPKNGCQAGCNSNTCLMTPLYARRAFAHAKAGDTYNALRDAEKSVVLDNKNPDVYCIRALVRSTRHETELALADTKRALRINPSHLCALIIKGRLAQPLVYDEWLDPGKKSENEAHTKACNINPDCHNYLTVQDFSHPSIITFYERFLYSLSVPHTICEVALAPRQGQGQHSRISSAKSSDSRGSVTGFHTAQEPLHPDANSSRAFRCGTPASTSRALEAARRRKMYGEAVREHSTRPQTAAECLAFLEKQRLRKQIAEAKRERLQKSRSYEMLLLGGGSTRLSKTPTTTDTSSPAVHNVKKPSVFQDTNVKDAPRMYYRPWLGDKLPIAEVERKQWISPPFK